MKLARIFFAVWINLFSSILVVLCVYSYTQNPNNIAYPAIAVSIFVVLAVLTAIVFSKKHGIWQPINPKLIDSENQKTKIIATKIVVVNNSTDKKYSIYARNKFGLSCTYSQGHNHNSISITITDFVDYEGKKSSSIRNVFYNFSILEFNTKTVTI